MKKVLMAVLILGAVLIASSAMAASYQGKMGVALLDNEHPIGLDFGVGDKAAFQVGVGFSKPKDVSLEWDVEGAFRGALVSTDNANLFARASVTYGQNPPGFSGSTFDRAVVAADTVALNDKTKRFTVGVELGAEWWPTSMLSFNVRHGVRFTSAKFAGESTDAASHSSFDSSGHLFDTAGFTLWFGGNKK